MKCSAYIATSADGFIADNQGGVDWLHTAGNQAADMSINPDMGFNEFIQSVDCMVMGRKCMEVISSFNLTEEQWPYGDIKIYVLSNTISEPPQNLANKVEMYRGDINTLIDKLTAQGFKHAYIDGGATICTFINLKLMDTLTITRSPILLGQGIPLFSNLVTRVNLEKASSISFPNDFIQEKYSVKYD